MFSVPRTIFCALVIVVASGKHEEAFARNCPPGIIGDPKGTTLYLYYPTAVDTQFPNWGVNSVSTSPLGAFDISQLDSGVGTQTALMARIERLAEVGLCEFDVDVQSTDIRPAPLEQRWQVMGIGTDSVPWPGGPGGDPIGGAQRANDYGDYYAQDNARLWVGELVQWAGVELTGTGSTPERWATAIANLVLHETGHNYGTGHGDAAPRTGEDAAWNHFMALPTMGWTPARLVGSLAHHSDASYEAMAHSVGLTAQTVSNWDFVNPNSATADRLVIKLMAPSPSNLTEGWIYGGQLSPWSTAVLVLNTSIYFHGIAHDEYLLIFHLDKPWLNGADGRVPGGAMFHVGASIQGGSYVIYDAILSSGGVDLPLHPRMVDFAGITGFRPAGGTGTTGFSLRLTNSSPERGPLIVRDLDVQFSPRMIDIETMVAGAIPRGLDDRPVALYSRERTRNRADIPERAALRQREFRLGGEPVAIPLAALSDPRHVMMDGSGCSERGSAPRETPGPAPANTGWTDNDGGCARRTALSLFPATYVYVSATIVDPAARHWDARRRRMVTGRVATRLFFQVAGTVPDANRNGVDDLLDIRSGRSRDLDRDGIPDEATARDARPVPGRR